MSAYILAEESYCNGDNIFISGNGGTGKTHFINKMLEEYPEIKAKVCAFTGVASKNFEHGCTIHSLLGITPKVSKAEHVRFVIPKIQQTLRSLDTIIIDESPMVPHDLLEIFDKIAKISRRSRAPFGGLQMVFVGDYYQLPPILKDGADCVYFFDTELYKSLCIKPFLFDIQYRQSNKDFIDVLADIRVGKYSDRVKEFEKKVRSNKVEITLDSTIITTTNRAKDKYNSDFMKKIQEDSYSYKSIDYVLDKKYQQKLDNNCNFLSELTLKKGCKVMLLKNYPDLNLVNGSMGIVVDLSPGYIQVQFKDVTTFIKKEKYELWDTHNNDLLLAKRTQFPLVLGYSVTVHKVQGITLESAVMDIDFAFAYGIIYVALSRVKTMEGISVISMDLSTLTENPVIDEWYKTTFNL
jgi:ATP-dependent DNA helicase PIF1